MAAARRARPDDIGDLAMSLPDVSATTTWGDLPSYAVRGKTFVIYRNPRPDALDADGNRLTDVIVIHCSAQDKQALVDDPDSPFFTTDHFNGYNAVLVRESELGRLEVSELAEVITDAWLAKAPKRLAKQWLAERGIAGT